VLLPSVTNETQIMDKSTARSRQPDAIRKTFLWALLPILLLVLTASDITYAQVTTNITPTTTTPLDLGTEVDTAGTTTQITGGTRPGNGTNLFHSFDSFTLGTGDTAHFLNDMQLPTNNIFGRVIGEEVSTIDGTLRTNNPLDALDPMNFGAANLWLVNPSGLLLGPNARIEVGGSVSMSTANYLRFENTSTLYDMLSTPASLGPLSVAPVAAFGFLGPELPAPITVQGSIFQVPKGQSLSLVGGDITVQAASLRAPGGQLNLVSVASPGEVLVPSFQTGSFTTMGTVMLTEGATLDVSGQLDVDGNPIGNGNGGTVFVRGGQLVIDASTILANTVGAVDGALTAVDVEVSQDVTLSNGASIFVATSGSGRAGDVQVTADTIGLDGAATLITQTDGDGNAGNITLNVGTLTLDFSATISSKSNPFFTSGLGQGGNVTVQGLLPGEGSAAESVTLSNGATITSLTFGPGDGGDILITSGAVQLNNIDTSINSSAFSFGETGAGGDLTLNVSKLTLTDVATIQSQSVTFSPGFGQGGNVTVQGLQGAGSAATSVDLSGGSSLVSQTQGSGDGGRVAITSESVKMDGVANIFTATFGTGLGGDIVVTVREADLSDAANITSFTDLLDTGAGASGTITVQGLKGDGIQADSLTLAGPGTGMFSSSSGAGSLGEIVVHAKTVSLKDAAAIQVGTQQDTAETAGNVTIVADSVGISGRGRIASQVLAADAGQVTITATQLTLDNGSIVTQTHGEGLAGDIVLDVGSVSLSNGATINSSSSLLDVNAGDAGTITIQSGSTVVLNNSSITTEASEASGGQITINAPEMVRLTNSQVSTSVAGSGTDTAGGNITIDPQFVILQNSQIIAQANAGAGGAINVTAGVFLADPSSVVDASSQSGPQGTVNIQSPVQNLGEELTPLSQQFSSAAALLAQRCAARVADGKFSTFVVAGREGLPAEPGGFLASPSWTADFSGSSLAGPYPRTLIAAVTGSFPEYDARPIQLWEFVSACR